MSLKLGGVDAARFHMQSHIFVSLVVFVEQNRVSQPASHMQREKKSKKERKMVKKRMKKMQSLAGL